MLMLRADLWVESTPGKMFVSALRLFIAEDGVRNRSGFFVGAPQNDGFTIDFPAPKKPPPKWYPKTRHPSRVPHCNDSFWIQKRIHCEKHCLEKDVPFALGWADHPAIRILDNQCNGPLRETCPWPTQGALTRHQWHLDQTQVYMLRLTGFVHHFCAHLTELSDSGR